MKKTIAIVTMIMIACGCNNDSKDTVDKADSANKAHIDSPTTNAPAVMTDAESSTFLVKAANSGMTEVQLGGLAREKGMDRKVKDFGAMMVHDHSDMNNEIKELAAKRNVILPEAISDDNRKKIDELSGKPRKEFDGSYIDMMIKNHESAIDLFTKAGNKVNDTDVKNFINNSLPKMKSHLDSVRTIRKSLK